MEVEQQVQHISETTSDNSFVPKSKRKWIISVGISIAVLIVLISILYAYQKGTSRSDSLTKTTQTPKLSPSPKAKTQAIENFNAISSDVTMTYFLKNTDHILLKTINFATKQTQQFTLPVHKTSAPEGVVPFERYILSPNNKYVVKLSKKKIEIASLVPDQLPVFKTIHTVPEMKGSKYIPSLDYAHVDDAAWDETGKLYFITSVGVDGVDNPHGTYADLYVANEDGTNIKLINDHTKDEENYGFYLSIYKIFPDSNRIYFSGYTHGGHNAPIMEVDTSTGEVVNILGEVTTDLSLPLFSRDLSKAYYITDYKEEGHAYPVKLKEYDFKTKTKRTIFQVPDIVEDGSSTYGLHQHSFLPTRQLVIFYQDGPNERQWYVKDLASESASKPISLKGNCTIKEVSKNEDYVFLMCFDEKTYSYHFYEVETEKMSDFYSEEKPKFQTTDEGFQLIHLK